MLDIGTVPVNRSYNGYRVNYPNQEKPNKTCLRYFPRKIQQVPSKPANFDGNGPMIGTLPSLA